MKTTQWAPFRGKTIILIALIAIISLCSLAPQPVAGLDWNNSFVQKPGIIRAIVVDGISKIGVPRGGAIVQPVFPLASSISFTLTVTGQACAVGDPLILMYRLPVIIPSPPTGLVTKKRMVSVPADIILTLPATFFYLTECGVAATTIDLTTRDRWVLTFIWDGERFVAQQDVCLPG